MLHVTNNSGVDTRCNLTYVCGVVRDIVLCIRASKEQCPDRKIMDAFMIMAKRLLKLA